MDSCHWRVNGLFKKVRKSELFSSVCFHYTRELHQTWLDTLSFLSERMPVFTVTPAVLNQLCWLKSKHTQTDMHTHTHSTDTMSVRGERPRWETPQDIKSKNMQNKWWLLTHTHTHIPQLTCHDGHWSWHTHWQACHRSCSCFSTLLFVPFSLSLSLLPNSHSGKLSVCSGCWRNCFQTSYEPWTFTQFRLVQISQCQRHEVLQICLPMCLYLKDVWL